MPTEPAYVLGMSSPSPLMTADELLHLHISDKHVELVRGVLVVREPAGYLHGDVTARLTKLLMVHVDAHDLGRVLAAETGFKLSGAPDTVRAPDIAFVGRARLPDPRPSGFLALAPDLAVEVLSPNDRAGEVLAQVADWLNGGSHLVWVVDPDRRLARVYRQDGTESLVMTEGALDGEDVVPGFVCPLESIV
jgi:Uma2 family endonuclease